MNNNPITVQEGATGILTITGHGGLEIYHPDCNMDEAIGLLREFQELRDLRGVALKDNYRVGMRDWYPCIVSQLFWYVFFSFVKYRPLFEKQVAGTACFKPITKGWFAILLGILNARNRNTFRQRVHDIAWKTHNRTICNRGPWDMAFFRFARKDFRSVEILETLGSEGLRVLQAVPAPGTFEIFRSILRKEPYYYFAQPNKTINGSAFRGSYALNGLDPVKRALFSAAIRLVETTLTTCMSELAEHKKCFLRAGIRGFYGFDDVNTYLFPLLYAARDLGLPTIGHQHGAYVKRHAGYMMYGIQEFEWFDKVVVWGDYWREKLLREAPVHPPQRWVVGCNKLKIPYADAASEKSPQSSGREKSSSPPRRVLIPYEFLADTTTVGRYITKLSMLGYEVFFRPRRDESLESQVDAYGLDDTTRAALNVEGGPLDAALLAKIDIVAGTMTTLVYELLPAGKIIWYLETPYQHLLDLVEEGLAHRIRLEDLKPPGQMPASLLEPTRVAPEHLFGRVSLQDSIRAHVLPSMSGQKASAQ